MIKSSEVINFLSKPVINYRDFEISEPCSIFELKNHSISFIYKENISFLDNLINKGEEILIIVPLFFKESLKVFPHTFILSESPKQDFVKVLNNFFVKLHTKEEFIHNTAIINKNATIHPSVKIGPYSIIGECKIGGNSLICDSVMINDNVVIGKNVKIHSGCKIGTFDFGPVRQENESVEMFPQIGKVLIEDNVEIFPMTCVGRGTLGVTHIKKGVKIDHQCQIGHNSVIGENTVITAHSVICGSTKIGKNCYIGVNSVLRNEKKIGDNVIVGMCSVITRDFGSNLLIFGNPAKIIRENKELYKF